MEYKSVEHRGATCYVTRAGIVKDLDGKERKWFLNADGYPCVSLRFNSGWGNVGVHILVAKAFIPNPLNKPEVNHKDFNRENPHYDNLEWVTHSENIEYSYKAGKYKGKFGKNNPNYGNRSLSQKYAINKELALLKQSRPRGQNGRAKPCRLYFHDGLIEEFSNQRDAFYKLVSFGVCIETQNPESVIRYLKSKKGYKGYFLYLK